MSSKESLSSILEPLSSEQRAVVAHADGHALVSAVAGSGKTLTLIQRILFLLHHGVQNDRILVVMYNRDIREAFEKRLKKACRPHGFAPPKVYTYHGLGERIGKQLMKQGKLPQTRFIADEYIYRGYLQSALTKAAEESDEQELAYKDGSFISELISQIDVWKGDLLEPKEVLKAVGFEQISPVLKEAYRYFEELRQDEGFRGFTDQIYDPVMAFREDPKLEEWVGNRYDHILVDEYQDINLMQQELIQCVAGTRAKVMAVGDEDQCIYEWRGSRPDYMTGLFEQFFQGAKRYTLTNTYRFGHTLSCVANSVMYHNKERTKKHCVSWKGTPQTEVKLYQSPDGASDGLITRLIKQWVNSGRRYKEAAILVRSWSMAIEPEMELMAAGIPCVLGDKSKSYKTRSEVQAVIGYLALGTQAGLKIINDNDRRHAVVNSLLRYTELFLKKPLRVELVRAITDSPDDYEAVFGDLASRKDVPEKVKEQLLDVSETWRSLSGELSAEMDAVLALRKIETDSNLKKRIEKVHVQVTSANDAIRAIDSLTSHARANSMSLQSLFDDLTATDSTEKPRSDAVLITSVHKAKGCEWPMVVLPKLEEGRFPHLESDDTEDAYVAQERRLFYVAMTRAIERLNLIAPDDEYMIEWLNNGYFGSPKKREIEASRFLYETGLARARNICSQLQQGVKPSSIILGEKEFLYQSYLKKIQYS